MKKIFILLFTVASTCFIYLELVNASKVKYYASFKEYSEEEKVNVGDLGDIFIIKNPILMALKTECKKYDLNFIEMLALIKVESNFKSKAVSYLGINYGYGLMQVSKICLKDYNLWNGTNYTQKDLADPYINIKIGCWVFNQNKKYTKGVYNTEILLSAYNIGVKATKKNGINHRYVNKVKLAKKDIDVHSIVIK